MHLVSVIIPIFNGESTIARALDSVLTQTYRELEIIVIDDGSTDGTQECLRRYKNQIRYFYQQNRERSAARNHGLHLAKGEFVNFLDADDWLMPDKIRMQVELLIANPNVGMVYSQAYGVDDTNKIVSLSGSSGNSQSQQAFYCELLNGNLMQSHTPLIRREILVAAGGFDESLHQGEDWDCWLRVAQITKVSFIPEALACYQISKGEALIRRINERGGAESSVRIIKKAIQRGGCPQETFERSLLMARFQDFLIEAGSGQIEAAGQSLETVQIQTSNLFPDIQDAFMEQAANIAVQVCLGETNTRSGISFLENVWMAIPNNFFPSWTWKKMLGNFYAIRFFQASQVEDRKQLFNSFLPMITNNPAWMKNRGVWSLFYRSLIGKHVSG